MHCASRSVRSPQSIGVHEVDLGEIEYQADTAISLNQLARVGRSAAPMRPLTGSTIVPDSMTPNPERGEPLSQDTPLASHVVYTSCPIDPANGEGTPIVKVVIIGGTGLIGSRVVTILRKRGHDAVAASPRSGVDTVSGQGLADVLQGASVVVDVSKPRTLEGTAAMTFFTISTRNLLRDEASAGVRHHVALSVVGVDRLSERRPSESEDTIRGYFRAKLTQEQLLKASAVPYSILRATQFFEFVTSIADAATDGLTVRAAPILFQPIAADDVAAAVGGLAVGVPVNGIVEVAGPQQVRLDDAIRRRLRALHDPRSIVTDPHAGYFGVQVDKDTLLPGRNARLGTVRLDDWLRQASPAT